MPDSLARGVQAFAIVLKGNLRSGRTRRDPGDPTCYRYDAAAALLHVRPLSHHVPQPAAGVCPC